MIASNPRAGSAKAARSRAASSRPGQATRREDTLVEELGDDPTVSVDDIVGVGALPATG
jgi:hypothetical protein